MENDTKEKPDQKDKPVSLGAMLGGRIAFRDVEEILSREVKAYGTGSAHVIVPKKHIGKQIQITIWAQDNDIQKSKEAQTK